MLNSYLVKYADSLDSRHYRVLLRQGLDHSANRSFHDNDYGSAGWFARYWHDMFLAKLRHIGLKAAPGSRVLDCCCGRGNLGRVFEAAYGAHTIYCDLSLSQLRDLTTHPPAGADPFPPAACAADLLHLPYPAESFDYVVGNSFLHHIPDVPAALDELRRVTRPNGTIVFLHEPTTASTFWESFPLSLLKDTSPTDATGGFTDLWVFEPDDLARLMAEAGLEDVRVFRSGMLSAFLLNWFFILAAKLNWRSRSGVYPAYLARIWLTQADLWLQRIHPIGRSPSVMVVARKVSPPSPTQGSTSTPRPSARLVDTMAPRPDLSTHGK